MKTGFANILVQNAFCGTCAQKIKKALSHIPDISNVVAYPDETLVTFNFIRANELASALNMLMDLGYPPLGDRIKKEHQVKPMCNCSKQGQLKTESLCPYLETTIPINYKNIA